jgi:predicted MPP superfamily phosphohydrolase
MSQDWLTWAALVPGQVALLVVSINMSHALAPDRRRADRIRYALLVVLWALMAWATWEIWRRPGGPWPWPVWGYVLACLATTLMGLPAAFWARACRRGPAGVSVLDAEIDLAQAEGADALIGRGRFASLLRIPGNESLRLRKCECEVRLAGLPRSLDGLTLLHLSDFHCAPCYTRRFFEAVADEAAGCDADLVLFTGDLIDHDSTVSWIVPVLSRLRGRLGSFAILGNHDYWQPQPERILGELEQAGFASLEGRWVQLGMHGSRLALGGTSFPWGPLPDPGTMPEADFRILLSHSPDQFARAARWGMDLVLAGHNHGGQVRFPVLGPVFMPSLYSRHFDRGFFRSGRTLMHVSQGVGGQHPVRFGCPPEISRLVLRPAEVAAAAPPPFSRRAGTGSAVRG